MQPLGILSALVLLTRPYWLQLVAASNELLVQLLSCVQCFGTPWTAACKASLSTVPQSLLQLISTELVMGQELLSVHRSRIQNAFSIHGFLLFP